MKKSKTIWPSVVSEQQIQNWITRFDKIQCVTTEENPDNDDILIRVDANLKTFMGVDTQGPDIIAQVVFVLDKTDLTFYFSNRYGENDAIFLKWEKEMIKSEAKSWKELYDWAGKLSKEYKKATRLLNKKRKN